MNRRKFILGSGVALSAVLAGCTGALSDGDTVIDETIRDSELYNEDVEEGQTIEISVENEQGFAMYIMIEDPDGEYILDEEVETEDSFTLEAEQTGVYRFDAYADSEGSLEVVLIDD